MWYFPQAVYYLSLKAHIKIDKYNFTVISYLTHQVLFTCISHFQGFLCHTVFQSKLAIWNILLKISIIKIMLKLSVFKVITSQDPILN
jgi:hypothetical protein